MIQIISEFYDAPEPDRIRQPIYTETDPVKRTQMVSPDRMDETLGWDEFVLGQGHAYTTPSDLEPEGTYAIVSKEYKLSGGRKLLVESVPVADLQFDSLPDCSVAPEQGQLKRFPDSASGYASLLSPRPIQQAAAAVRSSTIRLAKADYHSRPGVCIDWVATLGGTINTPYLFASDVNYYISGAVTLNGPVTLEASVIKYKTNAYINLNNALTCNTNSYRPAILTAIDDDRIGATFDFDPSYRGPSALENTRYANPAFRVQTPYAKTAIEYTGRSLNLSVSHSQFVNCIRGISLMGTGGCGCTGILTVNANNVLMATVQYPFGASYSTMPTSFRLIHCTIDNCIRLAEGTYNSNASLIATNSIIARAGAFNSPAAGYVVPSGYRNGFYICAPGHFGTGWLDAQSNPPFTTAGAGNYYLAVDPQTGLDASGFRDQGITVGLPGSLLNDLKKRTTYPPQDMSLSSISTDVVLPQFAARDSDGYPDLGYHADPGDYLMSGITVSGANMTLAPGVAILTYGNVGITLSDGASLTSIGGPLSRNHISRYLNVQEDPLLLAGSVTDYKSVLASTAGSSPPAVTGRFTDFEGYASGGYHIYTDATTHRPSSVGLKDCGFYSGRAAFSGSTATSLEINTTCSTGVIRNSAPTRC
jgi:hypothetical protein